MEKAVPQKPKKKETETEEEILLDDEELTNSYADKPDEWSMGDPTQLLCELPDPNKFFALNRRQGTGPVLTKNSVTITEEKEGFFQLIWENNGDVYVEIIKKISAFEYPKGIAYDIRTMMNFGSFEDNTYELTKDISQNFWELNNIYYDDPNTLLAAMEDVMLFESSMDTSTINLRNKYYGLKQEEVFAELPSDWIDLSIGGDGEWVIFEECMHGSGGFHWNLGERWLEFWGGGDAYPKKIDSLILYDSYIEMIYGEEFYTENTPEDRETISVKLYFTENDMLIFETEQGENRFISTEAKSQVRLIEEECDDEDY